MADSDEIKTDLGFLDSNADSSIQQGVTDTSRKPNEPPKSRHVRVSACLLDAVGGVTSCVPDILESSRFGANAHVRFQNGHPKRQIKIVNVSLLPWSLIANCHTDCFSSIKPKAEEGKQQPCRRLPKSLVS